MRVLAVNAGSSSVKLSVLADDDRVLGERDLAAPETELDRHELQAALGELPQADAVAHRVVHGGGRFRTAVRIDDEVISALRELTDLAPLHQPRSLAALAAVGELLPDTPAVACFDTAFHATLSPAVREYALPAELRERWRLRRYGFHGLSHAWIARRAPELLAVGARTQRIVSCHLGAGASLCAIADGASVDTTMGFTPLEGLVMATRSGSVDPGLLMWLLEHEALSPAELADQLEHRSGLLGLSGTADMAEVLERAGRGEPAARLALDVYLHRLCTQIAAMTVALGGIDLLVFTGGVGEHAPTVRAGAALRLAHLGVAVDEERNLEVSGDGEISAPGAGVRTLVVRAREDVEMVWQARALLGYPQTSAAT